ncbi:glycosyltransferase family 2 protein [Amycolatopsis sp. FDAARGOS 1241]|uniref:glycosyltransferase family 2 protein n=1 Tax=Amycolatopsis sp. FDAARGOS 1241 TaxID=2778070 RepID=UPI00194E0789|nr:glycosyltransferase family 2 protein [Amycolatopsis sp. FDAARGOS 1241]QRP47872.1 glycosyltransferase family 2 protein [Amycolatopsis sp. FDAARGOS 1241]
MGQGVDPKISIVIPARNEARNLEVILPELPEVDEVVLVDGHSVDQTVEVARKVLPSIVTLTQTRRGKGNALACGFEAACGDIIVMLDADGSADPAEIPAFIETLVQGADFAKGTRFHGHGGSDDITALRRAGNAALNKLTNVLYHTSFTDLCYGYNAFWRDIVPQLRLPPTAATAPGPGGFWGDGFEIETVLSCRVVAAGLTVAEVPSFERPRVFGETNLRTFADGARILRTILAEHRRYRALRNAGPSATGDVATQEIA